MFGVGKSFVVGSNRDSKSRTTTENMPSGEDLAEVSTIECVFLLLGVKQDSSSSQYVSLYLQAINFIPIAPPLGFMPSLPLLRLMCAGTWLEI